VEDDICQLGVQLILVEITMDLLQISEEGVFLQLKIDVTVSEPGFG
jgi:hypothetical protein